MRRVVLAMLVTLLPLTAAAQDAGGPVPATDTAIASSPTTDAASAQTTAPRPTKRRGSMVGYIEDPRVASQVRIRFDADRDMDSPDRAEYFYAKCGCYRDLAGNPAYDPDAPGPGPGLLRGMNASEFNVLGEYAFNPRVSVFAGIPIRTISPTAFVSGTGSFGNETGFSDMNAGVKLSLFSDAATDATVMVRTSLPTGDSRKGLGNAHTTLEPAFIFRRDLAERAGLEGQVGFWWPLSSSKGPLPGDGEFAGNILYYGIGPSFDVWQSGKTTVSPVVELVGWHVLGGYQTSTFLTDGGSVAGMNIANLKIGGRVTVNKSSFYVGYGFALTENDWYGKIVRIEYRAGF